MLMTRGYRFIADGLHNAGVVVSEDHVQRLCHEHKVFSVLSPKANKRPPAGRRAMAILSNGTSPLITRTRCGRLTSPGIQPAGGKLYMCAVKDLPRPRPPMPHGRP